MPIRHCILDTGWYRASTTRKLPRFAYYAVRGIHKEEWVNVHMDNIPKAQCEYRGYKLSRRDCPSSPSLHAVSEAQIHSFFRDTIPSYGFKLHQCLFYLRLRNFGAYRTLQLSLFPFPGFWRGCIRRRRCPRAVLRRSRARRQARCRGCRRRRWGGKTIRRKGL